MTDKIYYPETINQNIIPTQEETVFSDVSQPTSFSKEDGDNSYEPGVYKGDLPPAKAIPSDVISTSFNTQSRKILGNFSFGQLGAIQVGSYEDGVSGDIRISPNGIIARNEDGDTTFSLDGDTGNATFLGTVSAGSVISASISANNITAGTLSVVANVGSTSVKIDGANKRITVNDGSNDRILIGYLEGGF